MADFYADFQFPEVVLKIADAEKFCSVGDLVAGMKSGHGRIERFVEGGVVVHLMRDQTFCEGDTIVSPAGIAEIAGIAPC